MGRRAEQRRLEGEAWQEARQLRAELLAGRQLLPVDNHPVPFEHGELVFGLFPAVYARLFAEQVNEPASNVFVAGSPGFVAAAMAIEGWAQGSRIRRARQLAQPMWRAHEAVQVGVTDRRLWCLRRTTWLRFDYAALTGYWADLARRSIHLSFDSVAPLRLEGPWMPWVAVALASQLGGTERLHAPDLALLG